MACIIPSQRLIVPNSIFIGVVFGRSLGEIAPLNLFYKTEELINEGNIYHINKVASRGLSYSQPK